ncbi:unnamed protein product, partial [Urochloa humidicola]
RKREPREEDLGSSCCHDDTRYDDVDELVLQAAATTPGRSGAAPSRPLRSCAHKDEDFTTRRRPSEPAERRASTALAGHLVPAAPQCVTSDEPHGCVVHPKTPKNPRNHFMEHGNAFSHGVILCCAQNY